MTEKLSSLSTYSVTPSQTPVLSPKSTPAVLNTIHSKAETVEEEPYTIKCICNYSDDDGNTIYCETCDTWQHIECFYPHNIQDAYREDFAHSCHDCKPRNLDRQRAVERQRFRRSKMDTEETDRKQKRPPSKSHKKKAKPNDLQLNGHVGSEIAAKHPHEQTHTSQHKKSKSTHRPNHSISSQPSKRSPSYGQKHGNPHGHPPSPAYTPPDLPIDFATHDYSSGFLSLYNDDQVQDVRTNSFASLIISNALSLWLRDHDKLLQETGCDFKDVFQTLPAGDGELPRPSKVERKSLPVSPESRLHLQTLITPCAIEKDVPVVELNGQIGIQKDYCQDPENRWQELSSPLPFVFFHPMLPLYIDTRKEGSIARYVRRSCKPNTVLDTYLSGGSEYHFWLVSDRQIAPHEQITIPWDFRLPKKERARMLQLIDLGDDESSVQHEFDVNEIEYYHSIASWVHLILSEYGGCACGLGPDCAFARFYRNYISRSQNRSNSTSKKKSRKPKPHTISPSSTGYATNSRAPSEGHGDENDSGSSHSKPPSRDMTPARQGSFDTLGILTEPTDRDKRKVAMVEDSFRRMEQQQPPRKKKRTSDGGSSTTSKHKPRSYTNQGIPNGFPERRYVDTGTSRSMSGSPAGGVSPNLANPFKYSTSRNNSVPIASRRTSSGPHPEYCDAAVQTDPVEDAWYSPSGCTPKAKKRVVSLSKRLLGNRHRLRADTDDRRRLIGSPSSVVSAMVKMDLDSPSSREPTAKLVSPVTDDHKPLGAIVDAPVDTVMTDAPSESPTDLKGTMRSSTSPTMAVKTKSPELRVLMPPVPSFNSTTSSVTNPISAGITTAQSPLPTNLPSPFVSPAVNGATAHPSPVKKKLSLSDYTKSRMNKAASGKPGTTSLKPPNAIPEEAKSPSSEMAVVDSPTVERNADL